MVMATNRIQHRRPLPTRQHNSNKHYHQHHESKSSNSSSIISSSSSASLSCLGSLFLLSLILVAVCIVSSFSMYYRILSDERTRLDQHISAYKIRTTSILSDTAAAAAAAAGIPQTPPAQGDNLSTAATAAARTEKQLQQQPIVKGTSPVQNAGRPNPLTTTSQSSDRSSVVPPAAAAADDDTIRSNSNNKPSETTLEKVQQTSAMTTCTGPATTTRIVERRRRKRVVKALPTFLTGPGLKAIQDGTTTVAACEFVDAEWSKHFPHAMEQLYRCFSFWWANRDKQPMLLHPQGYAHLPASDGLASDKEIERLQKTDLVQFFRGMSLAFLQVFNVTTVVIENATATDANDATNNRSDQQRPEEIPSVHSKIVEGFWNHTYDMKSSDDAQELGDSIVQYYDIANAKNKDNNNLAGCRADHKSPRIGILNRLHGRSKRAILNAKELAQTVQKELLGDLSDKDPGAAVVPIVYFEDKSFLEQVEFYATTDIIISPHGAQLTGVTFMRECGALIEIFPMGYYYPDYFGSLAELAGIDHQLLYVSDGDIKEEVPLWMQNTHHRIQVRDANMCPDTQVIVEAIKTSMTSWSACCRMKKQ